MNIRESFDEWKTVLGFVTAIVVGTASIIAYASNTEEQIIVKMQAQAALVHDVFYQESRIARKEDQIVEHQRQLDYILEIIGDDEPTLRQARNLEYLDDEITRLRLEIEQIRVELAQLHE
jgi:hypothetical protein